MNSSDPSSRPYLAGFLFLLALSALIFVFLNFPPFTRFLQIVNSDFLFSFTASLLSFLKWTKSKIEITTKYWRCERIRWSNFWIQRHSLLHCHVGFLSCLYFVSHSLKSFLPSLQWIICSYLKWNLSSTKYEIFWLISSKAFSRFRFQEQSFWVFSLAHFLELLLVSFFVVLYVNFIHYCILSCSPFFSPLSI